MVADAQRRTLRARHRASAGQFCARALRPCGFASGVCSANMMARLRLHHGGLEKVAFDADVEKLRLGALLRFTRGDLLRRDDPADLALRIVEVAGDDRARRADDDARGLQLRAQSDGRRSCISPRCGCSDRLERVVGAGLHAGFAADAAAVVEIDDAVSRRKSAVVGQISTHGAASQWLQRITPKWRLVCRKLALLDVLDPRAEDADRYAMLFLAGDRAGVTADAAVVIDYEAVAQFDFPQQPARSDRPADSSGKMPVNSPASTSKTA